MFSGWFARSSEASSAKPSALRSLFLRALVTSLAAGGLVAIAALLFATFTQTTGRILGTLGALAVHCGLAMICAESMDRRRWPRTSLVGLCVFAANFCVLIVCIWWPAGAGDPVWRAALGTLCVICAYALAVPSADLLERGQYREMSLLGIVLCVVALAAVLLLLWGTGPPSEPLAKAAGVLAILAASNAHATLLLRVRGLRTARGVFQGALAAVGAVGLMGAISISGEIQDEFWYRCFGAVGVVDACGTLALLILAKLGKAEEREKLETVVARVELRCPRCTTSQTVDAGPSYCSACGLKFNIEIEEPRCAQCNYLLWQLPERRCPECGLTF